MEEKVKRVIVWQSILCPNCQAFIDSLPPEIWEAISNGNTMKCNHCETVFRVKFEILANNEAVEHKRAAGGAFQSCKNCNDDGCDVCDDGGLY